jgi:hypothetical protein
MPEIADDGVVVNFGNVRMNPQERAFVLPCEVCLRTNVPKWSELTNGQYVHVWCFRCICTLMEQYDGEVRRHA